MAYLAVARLKLRARRDSRWLGAFWLEELVYLGLVVLQEYREDWQKNVFVISLAGAGLLLSGVKVPDAVLPLRGIWLRWLLSVGVLWGLAQAGDVTWGNAFYGTHPVAVTVGGGVLLWLAFPAFRVLSEGWRAETSQDPA